jgi:hypothetical protein
MASPLVFKVYNEARRPGFSAAFKSAWDAIIFCLSVPDNLTVKYGGRIVWKNRKADKRSDECFRSQVDREYNKLIAKIDSNRDDSAARQARCHKKWQENNAR